MRRFEPATPKTHPARLVERVKLNAQAGIVKEAVASLYAARQRTILALIGIVTGIGSVIAMISIGTIAKLESLSQFEELGTDILTIQKMGGRHSADGRFIRESIKLPDALALPTAVASIAIATPWTQSYGKITYSGKRLDEGDVVGVTETFADLGKLRVAEGRFISDLDFRRPYCVVGAKVASSMRMAGAPRVVGESIKVAGKLYTVVGALEPISTWGRRNFDPSGSVFIPITTAMRSFPSADIQQITARMAPGVHYMTATREVQNYFRSRSRGLEIDVQSAKQLIEQMNSQMQLFSLLLGAVGSISLIVGGTGVMNIMLTSVSERHQEIGIRRALGARRRDIQNQFLIESILLSTVGGLLGIVLGILASYAVSYFAGWTFLVSLTAIALGVGVSSAVGIFFGFYPAYHAARLDPIAALRAN